MKRKLEYFLCKSAFDCFFKAIVSFNFLFGNDFGEFTSTQVRTFIATILKWFFRTLKSILAVSEPFQMAIDKVFLKFYPCFSSYWVNGTYYHTTSFRPICCLIKTTLKQRTKPCVFSVSMSDCIQISARQTTAVKFRINVHWPRHGQN